jgi:hypothetical protein
MTVTQHKSTISETTRSLNELALSGTDNRAVVNAAETWFVAANACQREMVDFVSKRLEKDSETFRAMMACKNPVEVTAIQSRWMEETLRDYSGEISKLSSICAAPATGRGGARGA